jgi:hypothetical protein
MYLLAPDKYELAEQKIAEASINCFFAKSVISKSVDGKIFVDNAYKPKAFYVIHPYRMSLLYGDISNAFLNNELKAYLLKVDGFRKKDESLQVFPSDIEEEIDTMLGDSMCVFHSDSNIDESLYSVIKHKRVNFKFNESKFTNLMKRIDLNLYNFTQVGVTHFNEFQGSVVPNKFWNNAADFSSQGFGYVLHYDQQPASIAFSSFRHENYLELGMETKYEFRRKGLATFVCAKLIHYCLKNGLEPVWSCKLSNNGSYNLAIKLGFEPTAYLPYYELL